MPETCVIVGASQAGVTCAFALREQGWEGDIVLYDADPTLPYYRPPLSKTILTGAESIDEHDLKPLSLYERDNIELNLGVRVSSLNRAARKIVLEDGNTRSYDKLVLATGSRPLVPPINGLETTSNVFLYRTIHDVRDVKAALEQSSRKRVVVIGGGYIGLETAASLRKLGAEVVVLEREERVLARVTAPGMSAYFQKLHASHGVEIHTGKNVVSFEKAEVGTKVVCADGTVYEADLVIIGVGVRVNVELAKEADLSVEDGIKVDGACRTSDSTIYSIGDCTHHFNPIYQRFIRLESIQNANDQANIAAASICGKDVTYNALPWFWSDQYDVKLQMVGLSDGYDELVTRDDGGETHKFSVWYFKGNTLLAVDAVNNTKAYVMGTKFIKAGSKVDKANLVNPEVEFKPANMLAE